MVGMALCISQAQVMAWPCPFSTMKITNSLERGGDPGLPQSGRGTPHWGKVPGRQQLGQG